MEAKDTVMSNPRVRAILYRAYMIGSGGQEYKLSKNGLDRLVSISFKAGQNEGRKETWDTAIKAAVDGGRREVVEFINDLIIGIEGCKFEERLDGDKGCVVLDMNENQWQAKLKEWGITASEKAQNPLPDPTG